MAAMLLLLPPNTADQGFAGEMFKCKRTDADLWSIVEKRHHQEPVNSKHALGLIRKNRVG